MPPPTPPLACRGDLADLLLRLWHPVGACLRRPHAERLLGPELGHAGFPAARLEAFARLWWGLAPYAAGGGRFADWPLLRAQFGAGVDPASPEFFGETGDHDQRFVEMAPLCFAILLAPAETWHPLPADTQRLACQWLATINEHSLPPTNWRFFRVLVNLALRQAGSPLASASIMTEDLDLLESFACEHGWYTDGPYPQRDYYVPMGFHFGGLLYAHFHGAHDPQRARRFRERAATFAGDFAAWFTRSGAALPYGRSLTYRFAQSAFWGALAFADLEALPWGVVKGLYFRNLRWWLQRPIFKPGGELHLGYGYPNHIVGEAYNSSASPYWCAKAFLPLALPEDHPFWRAEESELPAAPVRVQPGSRMVVCRDDSRDHVFALSANYEPTLRFRHAPQKYAKFCYSTEFGFNVCIGQPAVPLSAAEGMLLLSDDGRDWRARTEIEGTPSFDETGVFAAWRPWPDVHVLTWLVPVLPGHVRIHRIDSARELTSIEGAFALPWRERREVQVLADGPGVLASSTTHAVGAFAQEAGATHSARGAVENLDPGTNLLHPHTVLPLIRRRLPAGRTWLVTSVSGGKLPDPHDPAAWHRLFAWQESGKERRLTHGEAAVWRQAGEEPPAEA